VFAKAYTLPEICERLKVEKKDQLKGLLSNTKALLGAMRNSATSVSGEYANVGRFSSFKTFLGKYNKLAKQAAPLLTNATMLDLFNLDNIKGSADYTWVQQKELFDSAYSNAVLLKSLLEGEIGYAEDETHNLIDFFQANLRRAIFVTPEREAEIQNAVETLIVGRGMAKGTDYDRETGRVKTSGKEWNCGALTSVGGVPTDRASHWTSGLATGHDARTMMIEPPTPPAMSYELASVLSCGTQEICCWFVQLRMV
jgi:hypothetical protein